MKPRSYWASALIFALLSFGFISDGCAVVQRCEKHEQRHSQEREGCKYGQCEAIAKSTQARCKRCVSGPGDEYCWQHD